MQTVYDKVPYPSYSFVQSHPDHLATLATLLGMDPPPVDRSRVLELGCASGGNLIPMAYGLPGSEFVGIDLSARQVAEGQAMIAELGLTNVSLRQLDILDVGPSLGQFDYIIAHGVYSWVPPEVRDKLLAICRQQLAPTGVAYISYNIYPGWHMLRSIRDVMLYHTRRSTDPAQQVVEARRFLEFLGRSIPAEYGPFAALFQSWINFVQENLLAREDAFLLHDELSTFNEPVYFHQFAAHAAAHGLRYLADAQFQSMLVTNLATDVAETLRQAAQSTVELEQYIDFLYNRAFRQSLLCQQEVSLTARVDPARLTRFYAASPAQPESSEPDLKTISVEKFRAADGAVLTTDHPVTKAAMRHLMTVWPQAVPFDELLARARRQVDGAGSSLDQDELLLGANLLKAFGYSDNLVELHVRPPRLVTEVSRCPLASPIARLQARQSRRVTNLRHERLSLNESARQLLLHLDGRHDGIALLDVLKKLVESGTIELEKNEEAVVDAAEIEQVLPDFLATKLQQLARAALLVG